MEDKKVLIIGHGKCNDELIELLSKGIGHNHKWIKADKTTNDVVCKICGVKAMRSQTYLDKRQSNEIKR